MTTETVRVFAVTYADIPGEVGLELDSDGLWVRWRADQWDQWGPPVRANELPSQQSSTARVEQIEQAFTAGWTARDVRNVRPQQWTRIDDPGLARLADTPGLIEEDFAEWVATSG